MTLTGSAMDRGQKTSNTCLNRQQPKQSHMQQALKILSSPESGKSGLSNDPLTLLLLSMEPEVLDGQIAVGAHLLRTLSDGGVRVDEPSVRRALVQEVRAHLLSSDEYWDDLDGWREVLLLKCAGAVRGNKGDVMNALGERVEKKGPCCFCPSLLQIVFDRREGKQHSPRTHVILERWTQVIVYEREALFRRSHQSIVHDVPRQIVEVGSSSCFVSCNACAFTFICVCNDWFHAQVPTDFSVRKFYQDWDCSLSKVEASGFFDGLDDSLLSHAEFDASILHSSASSPRDYPWKVQVLRRIALDTPQTVCKMLARMKCFRSQEDEDAMFVLVKEGTRRVVAVDKGQSSAGGGEDWKISFHFVFQVTVSHFQFKCLYEMITSLISSTSLDERGSGCCAPDVAFALELIDERDYEQLCARDAKRLKTGSEGQAQLRADHHTRLKNLAMRGSLAGALEAIQKNWVTGTSSKEKGKGKLNLGPLVGMDLHPLQTEFQGLACLGSWKDGAERGNSLLGMMRIPLRDADRVGTREWEWVKGYSEESAPLLILAEASTIIPGPRCMGLSAMASWEPMVHSSRRRAADKDTADRMAMVTTDERHGSNSGERRGLDSSLIECKQRLQMGIDSLLQRAPKLKAVACTYMGADGWKVRQVKSVIKLASKNGDNVVLKPHMALCHQMLSGGSGVVVAAAAAYTSSCGYGKAEVMERVPHWFRKCMDSLFGSKGGARQSLSTALLGDAWQMAFQSSSVNVRYAHVPDELADVRSECRLIHVSTNAMRICTLELMRIPFVVRKPFALYTEFGYEFRHAPMHFNSMQ